MSSRVKERLVSELRILSTVEDGQRVDLSGAVVVVIDVLRATTSLVYMFASGAKVVYPVGEVEAARRKKKHMPGALLCGERNGVPPEGFDMGNSPSAFAESDLSGKELILTTTNGTGAVDAAKDAAMLLSGACVNAAAVARRICMHPAESPVFLLCAGTRGAFSIEDYYCAGLIASHLQQTCAAVLDDFAWAAVKLAELPVDDVVNAETCRHLKFLLESGFKADVELALNTMDANPVVPVYDRSAGCFVPSVEERAG